MEGAPPAAASAPPGCESNPVSEANAKPAPPLLEVLKGFCPVPSCGALKGPTTSIPPV